MKNCSLCGREKLKKKKMSQGIYGFCSNCQLISLDPQNLISLQEEKERYLEHDNTLENEGYVKMFKEFISRAVNPLVKVRGKALDYGCGPEPVLGELLHREGFSVEVFDPFFFPQKELEKGSFDLITCTEVLEHISDAGDLWERVLSLLRPEGVFALMTHFHPGWEDFPGWWYHRDPTHITFYNQRTLEWINENMPLELLYQDSHKVASFRKQ